MEFKPSRKQRRAIEAAVNEVVGFAASQGIQLFEDTPDDPTFEPPLVAITPAPSGTDSLPGSAQLAAEQLLTEPQLHDPLSPQSANGELSA